MCYRLAEKLKQNKCEMYAKRIILLMVPECDRNEFEKYNRIFVDEISELQNIFILYTIYDILAWISSTRNT